MKKSRAFNVPTLGIVRHSTGEESPEGAAADCLNFRYRDGALRRFGDPEAMFSKTFSPLGAEKLFHPILPDGDFFYMLNNTCYIQRGNTSSAIITLESGEDFVSWVAFGLTVIISTSKYTRVLIYNKDSWKVINPLNVNSSIQLSNNPLNGVTIKPEYAGAQFFDYDFYYTLLKPDGETSSNVTTSELFSSQKSSMAASGLVHGVARMVACVKLNDGSLICISTPQTIQFGISKTTVEYPLDIWPFEISDNNCFVVAKSYEDFSAVNNKYRVGIIGGPFFCKPELTVKIDDGLIGFIQSLIDSDQVSNLSIFTTRLFDVVDASKTWRNYSDIQKKAYLGKDNAGSYYWYATFAEIDVAEPYYLLKDIKVSDISNSFTITLKPEDFSNITSHEILVPNGTRHIITSNGSMLDYNSRIHACGIKTTFASGDNIMPVSYQNTIKTPISEYHGWLSNQIPNLQLHIEVDISADGQIFTVGRKVDGCLYMKSFPNYVTGSGVVWSHALVLPNIVAYPDARATKMRVVADTATESYLLAELPLKQSLETNISYSIGTYETYVSPPIHVFVIPTSVDNYALPDFSKLKKWTPLSIISNRPLIQKNRLQVWAYGSPFFYELKNSYRIGGHDEQLLRVETTADQLSEGRFGQYPLYCFTNKQLFALEQGSGNVLYAACHPISPDGILNAKGATSITNAVAFTSRRGILVVQGRDVQEISRPLKGHIDDLVRNYIKTEVDFDVFLEKAILYRLYRYNELLVHNHLYGYAYIYNIDSKMWTRRDLIGDIYRSSNRLIQCRQDGLSLNAFDLERETQQCSNTAFWMSRQLELGTHGYKKIEQAILRTVEQSKGSDITMTILGSIDGIRYAQIQRVKAYNLNFNSIRAGRAGVSVRYVIIVIECSKDVYTTLQQIDFELEDRYNSKLR